MRDGTFQGTHPAAGMERQHLIRLIVGEESTTKVIASQTLEKRAQVTQPEPSSLAGSAPNGLTAST